MPATIKNTVSDSWAIIWFILPAISLKFLANLFFGTIPKPTSLDTIIARALAQEPILLFLDEPTAHLDIGHQIQILDLLKKLNQQNNLTIVMVLHDLNLASAYCNRIVLFDNGTIFKEGKPEDVLTYRNIEAVYKTIVLIQENPLTHKPNVVLVPGDKLCKRSWF